MRSQLRLGSLFGISIGLHYSWFLIALLIVFSLATDFRAHFPQEPVSLAVAAAVATALLFFVCLLLHELAHSLVAQSCGMPVREITLFALGGVSQIEGETTTATVEFWMAIVGPLTSAALGLFCLGVSLLMSGSTAPTLPAATLSWLGYINLGLALFNMVPGYPLDGGRVLRAIIWWKTGDADRATRVASMVGQVVAGVFIATGIVQFFNGAGLGGLWITFIGWFLLQAAAASRLEVGLKRAMNDVRVADVMIHECPTVDGSRTVQDLVDHEVLRTGRRCFVVVGNSHVAGLVTPHEIKTVDRARWPFVTVDHVMRPLQDVRTVTPDTPLMTAIETMRREDVSQLPVVTDGHLEGVLSRGEVLSYLQTQTELQA